MSKFRTKYFIMRMNYPDNFSSKLKARTSGVACSSSDPILSWQAEESECYDQTLSPNDRRGGPRFGMCHVPSQHLLPRRSDNICILEIPVIKLIKAEVEGHNVIFDQTNWDM